MIELSSEILTKIKEEIDNNAVILFMKGSADFPQCGFSATVVSILNKMNVDFSHVNILLDHEMREAIKKYSDWPTIPQLYIKGEFIGGCDIVREMFLSNEFEELLKSKEIPYDVNYRSNTNQ